MRVNRPLQFLKWIPTAQAMGPMLRELYANPQKGFLGAETFIYWPGVALVQYWRSFEDLERFARNPDDTHLPAWQRFNRTIGKDGSVGVFHETVPRGARKLRGDLRQHARLRTGEGDPTRQGDRGKGDGAATPDARR
jgi:hypothetical protein